LHPVRYATDEVIYTEGWNIKENKEDRSNYNMAGISIIVVGECLVTASVKLNEKGKVSCVNLGRIGPGGVLYHFCVQDPDEGEKGTFHTETITASAPIHAYTISRGDFLLKLDSNSREAILREIRLGKDTEALEGISRVQWVQKEAWVCFKKSMIRGEKAKIGNKNNTLLDNFRLLDRVRFSSINQEPDKSPAALDPEQHGNHKILSGQIERGGEFDDDIEFFRRSLRAGKSKTTGLNERDIWSADPDSDVAASIRIMRSTDCGDSREVLQAINRNNRSAGGHSRLTFRSPPATPKSSSYRLDWAPATADFEAMESIDRLQVSETIDSKDRLQVLPFSLVHVHRETIPVFKTDSSDNHSSSKNKKKVAGAGLEQLGCRRKRSIRCYLRLCGTMWSPQVARECAEAQVR
jgi:hypothetical protein